ncbi:peptide-methionine (R)-S-oxide reductase MsrB [Sphingomonas sp. FW199]|uniref:peptide-methionine (R)-S-oxide reductase MsrB n=1 Tax=Sphingomonas sp. FW199 TaxID=3400217 RepID=UPI003CF2B276
MTSRRQFLTSAAMGGVAMTIGCSTGESAAARGKFEVQLSDAEWKKRLGSDRFRILREQGTERPFTSPLNNEKRAGTFACAGCKLPLYSSRTKFDSGTGWPSFWQALPNAVGTERDVSYGMIRTEVHCRRCGGHLGHIFDDGPKPTGKRHCINGLSLTFAPGKAA